MSRLFARIHGVSFLSPRPNPSPISHLITYRPTTLRAFCRTTGRRTGIWLESLVDVGSGGLQEAIQSTSDDMADELATHGVPLEEEEGQEEEIDLHPSGMTEANEHRVSRYQAMKACSHVIMEGDRPLAEYMTLPVSQYSVLDAEKVERLDENTFKVQTSTVSLFRIKMTPVMILTVKPHDTGCEVQLLKCTVATIAVIMDGKMNSNQRFACYMRNYVSYTKNEETGQLMLTGDCIVQVAGIVPRWINAIVPIKAFNVLGTKMLAKILDVAMPRFLLQLEKDYQTWASGDDSRKAMSTGESFGLGEEVLTATNDNAN